MITVAETEAAIVRRILLLVSCCFAVGGTFTGCHVSQNADRTKASVARLKHEVTRILNEAFPQPIDPHMALEEKQRKLTRAYEELKAVDISDCPAEVQLEYKQYVAAMHKSADFRNEEWPKLQAAPNDSAVDARKSEGMAAVGAQLRQEGARLEEVLNKYMR